MIRAAILAAATTVAVIVLLVETTALRSQTAGGPRSSSRTFTSPDGTFSFEYAALLVLCARRDPKNSDQWSPGSCSSFIPVCDDYTSSGGTVACIAYPADKVKETNLQAATFSVAEIKGDTTERKCLQGVPDRDFPIHSVRINGTEFKSSEVDGVATGSSLDAYVYRAFHQNKCYELDLRIALSSPALYDSGNVRTIDLRQVRKPLDQALKSFRFLK
jgi:hypothetical protein